MRFWTDEQNHDDKYFYVEDTEQDTEEVVLVSIKAFGLAEAYRLAEMIAAAMNAEEGK